MNETTGKLRTATFGGFRRQDVVDYIEAVTREHTAQLNALRAELKQAQTSLEAMEGERSRGDELEERCDALNRRVDELTPLEAEVAELRAKAEEYRSRAEAYDKLKDTLAEMELDARSRSAALLQEAHERAETILAEAQARAEATRTAAESEVEAARSEAEEEIGAARAEAADLVQKAEADRAEARAVLNRVTEEYGRVGNRADQAILRVIGQLGDLRAALAILSQPDEEEDPDGFTPAERRP